MTEVADSAEAGARFIRGGIFRLLTFGAGVLFSLCSVPLVTRHLGPSGYGYFGTISAMVFIVGGFTEGGLTTLAIREYTNSPASERTALLRNMIGLRVTATAVAVLCVALVTAAIGSPGQIPLGVLLAGAGLTVTIVGENLTIPLLVDLRITTSALLDLLRLAVLTGTYVGLVLIGASVLPFLGATLLSGAVLLGATASVLGNEAVRRPACDLAVWRRLLKQTLPYAVAAAVGVIYFREALVLIEYLSTPRQAGYYTAAFRIVEVLASLPWMVISASFPILTRAAHDDPARLRYAFQRLFEVAAIVGVWMSLCVLVAAHLGIAVVAGSKYGPAVEVLEIQGVAVFTSFMVATFGFVLLSMRLYRALLWCNAAAVTTATILSVSLIPTDGARGAAIAATGAEAILAAAYAVAIARSERSLRVSLRVLPRVALAAGAAVGAAYAASGLGIVRLVIVTCVYFTTALLLRAVPFELWNALLRRTPGPSATESAADEGLGAGRQHEGDPT